MTRAPDEMAVARAAAAIARQGAVDPDDPAVQEVFAALAVVDCVRDDPRVVAWRTEALPPARRIWIGLAAVAASVVAVASAAVMMLERSGIDPVSMMRPAPQLARQSFRTAPMQRAVVTLEDGSIVTLDSDTDIDVSFSAGRRSIALRQGHAYFEVAHDSAHPFVVSANGKTVTALGTAFGVTVGRNEVAVVLVEGSVKVASAPPSKDVAIRPAGVVLQRGMKLIVSQDRWKVVEASVSQEVGWTKGQLVFEDEPIADAIGRMNQYSRRKLVLADDAIGERRISGVFPIGSPGTFAHGLEAYGIARIERDGQNEIVLR